MDQIRILLADDHDLFREGLAGIIAAQPDMVVVGEASDGLEAIVKAHSLKPDLILMDIQMPACDGLEATRQIKKDMPDVVVVMLTVRDEDEKLFTALKNGAQGYLLKNIRSHDMLEMLRGSLRGEAAISPALAGRVLEEFRRLSRLAPHGSLKGRRYTYQWASMFILLYFTEGVMRAWSDPQPAASLAVVEIVLSVVFFLAAIGYARKTAPPKHGAI